MKVEVIDPKNCPFLGPIGVTVQNSRICSLSGTKEMPCIHIVCNEDGDVIFAGFYCQTLELKSMEVIFNFDSPYDLTKNI
ncbi:MAG: hypothetical protein ACOH2V_00430 [Candidatus Saccharimonadaceae bacterium]